MTATNYVTLDNDDLGANKIFRAATASALDTNPVSIAQRGLGAPWLNGIGLIEAKTTGSGNWTVPDGVYRIKATAIGGGGGGNGSSTSGTSSTFSTITGGGGVSSASGGTGGSASGGDINLPGTSDLSPAGGGGLSAIACVGKGDVAGAGGVGGGGGGTAIKVFSVEPGDLMAYSVGASGGGVSTAGIIIIEY